MAYSGMNILLVIACLIFTFSCSLATNVTYDSNAIIINGERKILFGGSIHYPRSTVDMWPDIIQKAKDGGIDVIETYIFWDRHEPRRREYDFSGNLDFIKFFKMAQDAGMYVFLRIGPYVCAEWNYGGFPAWLHNIPEIELRTNNQVYKDEMQLFVSKIINMCKEANLFAPQGGPIILGQIENEYGNIMESYGDAGKEYVKWAAQMANSMDIGVPWVMCQQKDAPEPMIETCNGFYCDKFTPNNPKSPKLWTENWTGWYKRWGERTPKRTAEDLAYGVAKFFQTGGVLVNYYMYHGGTNFGRTSGGPFITTSYDYDAPLDEYGNLNQPKWGHLKELHEALKVGEKILTAGNFTNKNMGSGVMLTTYNSNASGERFCFLSNSNNASGVDIDLKQDGKYHVPAWSVSILKGCNQEIYNSAKVNTQSSTLAMKRDAQHKGNKLAWKWAPEDIHDTLNGAGGKFKVGQLLEQLSLTEDASDFLWYMTSVKINGTVSAMKNLTLRVNTTGGLLQMYVNKKYVGAEWAQFGGGFKLNKTVSLKTGKNKITILSATNGLAHYGPRFDVKPYGLAGGPVELITSNGSVVMDLSTSQWSYKIGLNGEKKMLYSPLSHQKGKKIWRTPGHLPKNRSMTWYSTTFKNPAGQEPVVVNLHGMGKGEAWVNGHSIGRFWPSYTTNTTGCSDSCNYRGEYVPEVSCNTNCGKPTQIYYHIPRSFLNKNGTNTLILFEQLGGDPSNISFHTTTIGTICGSASENSTLTLSCRPGSIISKIQFASFGDPQGSCGSFKKGPSDATMSVSIVEKLCVGRQSCAIEVTPATFGIGKGNPSRLAVDALCLVKYL